MTRTPTSSDPLTRFSDRVADYVRHRPSYPSESIDAVLDGLAKPSRLVAADIGAGTGIASNLLADRGVRVHAIEPNTPMREAATPDERITWHDGSAEDTGLKKKSVHLVLCAQAFHWFNQTRALPEFARILRNHGRLALLWNIRDPEDRVARAYTEALHRSSVDPISNRPDYNECVGELDGFSEVRRLEFPNFQELTIEGLLGRARSASYVPTTGHRWESLSSALADVHAQHEGVGCEPGMVRFGYVTRLYLAEKL